MIGRRTALLVVALACDAPVQSSGPVRPQLTYREPVSSDLLEIDSANDTLNLINRTADDVFYFVSEWRGPTLGFKPAPCTEPTSCTNVARRDTRRIAFTDIAGVNQATTDLVVIHWRLVAATPEPGFRPDSIRQTIVPLVR
jgi:hypothetical protein